MSLADRRDAIQRSLNSVQMVSSELEFREMISKDGEKIIREHRIEQINKFTLSLTCLIFFFIGAPLGAIIRKGGLGLPVIISVLVFIVFFILDNTGYRMSRIGEWPVWFGKGLAPAVLIPLATFVTYRPTKERLESKLNPKHLSLIRPAELGNKGKTQGKKSVIKELAMSLNKT